MKTTKIKALPEHVKDFYEGLTIDRKCAKLTTVSIVETPYGQLFGGSNWCVNPQEECPRKDLPTGVGYELCIDICKQLYHSEVDACIKAGERAIGGKLYLIGHYYSCDDCQKFMKRHGIEELIILEE